MNELIDEVEEQQELFEHWKFLVDKGQDPFKNR